MSEVVGTGGKRQAPSVGRFEEVASSQCFGGTQLTVAHDSETTGTRMRVGIYLPPAAKSAAVPAVYYLSGLTCTEENFTVKAGAQRMAAEAGLVLVAPDTSPRGDGVANAPDYDLGQGAGFYVDSTMQPWARHFRMHSYLTRELPDLIAGSFPVKREAVGICGHSMGGHGALTVSLRNPGRFKSTSAFAPIVSPIDCPWGEKALSGYLGADRAAWREYDACALIEDGARLPDLLVDQGTADNFLDEQLKTNLLDAVCRKVDMPATIRMQEGYDHSYYFISTFMADHIAWHAERLTS